MTDENNDIDQDGTEDTGTDTGANGRTFTQAEVDKLLAKTRSQGARQGANAVAEQLGMSIEDAKAFIASQQQAREAEMTEAQRAKAEAERIRAEANQVVANARAAQLRADATVALLGGDVPLNRGRLDLALRVVLPDVLDSDDDDALTTAIERLRGQSPEWFALSNDGDNRPPPTPPPGTPRRTANEGKQPPNGPKDQARRFWEEQKARSRPPMPTT